MCISDKLEVWHTPAPTSDQNIAERRYKHVVGIIKHNEPVDTTHVGLIYYRRYERGSLPGVLRTAMQNGHIRRGKDGWVTTEEVR